MSTKLIHHDIAFRQYLNEAGKPVGGLPDFGQDPDELIKLYRMMVLTRTFDEKAIALQRTGRLGTYASSLGQEAVTVGVGAAMRADDVFLPTFREHGTQLWRGVTLVELLQYWGGDERGSNFSGPREDFPVCIPVGSHVPHAVGVAVAFQLRREDRVAVCIFGDGATSKGDFYEALNVAGIWNLPVVMVINNNQWAISVPRSAQSASKTLAQKGIAAGVSGIQIDGNDVIAVRRVVEEAIAQARANKGPTLIEAITYRMGDHTTSDDASRYRDDEEVSRHWKQDPLIRVRTYLTELGLWQKEDEEKLLLYCTEEVQKASDEYLALPPEPPEAIFDYLYETLPPSLVYQREALHEQRQMT